MSAPAAAADVATRAPAAGAPRRPGRLAPLRWELRKLRAQQRARAVLIGSLLLPVVVVVVMVAWTGVALWAYADARRRTPLPRWIRNRPGRLPGHPSRGPARRDRHRRPGRLRSRLLRS